VSQRPECVISNVVTHETGQVCGLIDIYDATHDELTTFGAGPGCETKRRTLSRGEGDWLALNVYH
jgi:hypothetical protein